MADRRVDELARRAAEALDCQVLHRLGQGGMAVVVLAEERSGRKVAVKVLTDTNERTRERFQREGQILAGLPSHDNLVRVHRLILDPVPALALDYIKGETLLERLRRGALSEAEVLALIAGVADGLAVAHTAGLIHRDIKPANILLTATGTPVLTDFGVALGSNSRTLTQTGETVGTPAYMAPEQIAGDRAELSAATDIWALGVVLYECLGRTLPFPGQTIVELVTQICTRPPRPLPVAVSEPTQRLIRRALEKEPGDRFADAAEFADACRDAARGRSVDPGRRPKLRWISYALISLAALIVITGAAAHVRLRTRRQAELRQVTEALSRVGPRRDKVSLDNLDQAILAAGGGPARPPAPSPALAEALALRHREAQLRSSLGLGPPMRDPGLDAWLTLATALRSEEVLALPPTRLEDLAANLDKRAETRSTGLGLRVLMALHQARPLPRIGRPASTTVQTALDGARLGEDLFKSLEASGGVLGRRLLERLRRFRPRPLLNTIWRQRLRHRLDHGGADARRRILLTLADGYWTHPELHELLGRPPLEAADTAALEGDLDISRHPKLRTPSATRLVTTLLRWCEVWPGAPAPPLEPLARAIIGRLNLLVRQGIFTRDPSSADLILRFFTALSRHDRFSQDPILDAAIVYASVPIPLRRDDARALVDYWRLHEAATWLLLPTRGEAHRQRKKRLTRALTERLRRFMTEPHGALTPPLQKALDEQLLNAMTALPARWPGQPEPPAALRLALVERARPSLPSARMPYQSAAMLVEFETDLLARLGRPATEIDARRQTIARELAVVVKASPPSLSSAAPFFLSGSQKLRQIWAMALLRSSCATRHQADIRAARVLVLESPSRGRESYEALTRSFLVTDGPAAARDFLANLPKDLQPKEDEDFAAVRAVRELVERASSQRLRSGR